MKEGFKKSQRRFMAYVLVFVMLFGSLPVNVAVASGSEGGFTYRIIDGTYAAITGFTGSEVNLVIPGVIGGRIVREIDANAFQNNTALTTVIIPDSVTSIGSEAFHGNTSLTYVDLGRNVTSIGWWAFGNTRSLVEITIPDAATTIDGSAFSSSWSGTSDTRQIRRINVPATVTSIHTVFITNNNVLRVLEAYNVDPANPNYESVDGVLFNRGQTELIRYPRAKADTSYVIPNTVTMIRANAFDQSLNLTSVVIGNNVTTIGNSAFSGCSNLRTATFFGNAPTNFGTNVFWGTANGFTIHFTNNNPAAGWTTPTWHGYNAIYVGVERPITPGTPLLISRASETISFRWSASLSNVDLREYRIFRDNVQIATVPASILSFTDTGLTVGAAYSYSIEAVDVADRVSYRSLAVSFTTVLPQIESFTQLADSYYLNETHWIALRATTRNDQNTDGLTGTFEYRRAGSTE